MPQTARVRVAREQVRRIAVLIREAETLKRELRGLIRAQRPELLSSVITTTCQQSDARQQSMMARVGASPER